jgi:hypothetical protein
MDKISRRIGGKVREYPVYTVEEAKFDSIYWKQAQDGDWAKTDDGYVAECVSRKEYTDAKGRIKTLVKLTCGVQWVTNTSILLYERNRDANIYSMVKPKSWQEREAKKSRTKNAVSSYVAQVVNGQKPDWEQIGNIYRPDQKNPPATVRRLFKQEVIRNMIEEKLKEVLVSKGINKGFVLDTILDAIEIAKEKQDVSNILRAAENFIDLLEMRPNKKITTDTVQIDMTSQIVDQIETEEKKLIASRKTESTDVSHDEISV